VRRKSLIEKATTSSIRGDIETSTPSWARPIAVPDAAALEDLGVPSAVPHEVTNDDGSGPIQDEGPTPLPPPWVIEDVDDPSGPRVVTSMGADSASAAGEVMRGDGHGKGNEPARELVTILPKRSTREIPVITQEEADAITAEPEAAAVKEADALDEKLMPVEEPAPPLRTEAVGRPRRPCTCRRRRANR
jgi:hypothetical protein